MGELVGENWGENSLFNKFVFFFWEYWCWHLLLKLDLSRRRSLRARELRSRRHCVRIQSKGLSGAFSPSTPIIDLIIDLVISLIISLRISFFQCVIPLLQRVVSYKFWESILTLSQHSWHSVQSTAILQLILQLIL